MKLSNVILFAAASAKSSRNWVGKNGNRYLPECESGRFGVAEISSLDDKLNDSASSWDESLNHHFGTCWMQGRTEPLRVNGPINCPLQIQIPRQLVHKIQDHKLDF